jgi:Gas vesicle synthesis protein GvpO
MADAQNDGKLSALDLARAARLAIQELTGYRSEAATALEWDGDSWCVTVAALELERVPNTTDVLGEYQVRLDGQGTLRGYKRVRRYTRGESGDQQ